MSQDPTYEELEQQLRQVSQEAARCKLAQAELRAEQDFTSAVLGASGALVVVLDTGGRIVRFNKACERLTGYSFDEVQGRVFWDFLLTAAEVETVQRVFSTLRSGQFPNEHENDWVAKDGTRWRIMWSNTAVVDDRGEVKYIIATGIDITERKKAELALQESQERYRRITEAVTDYIYTVIIRDGRPVETIHRPGCESVTGFKAKDFEVNPYLWIHMVPNEDRPVVQRQAARLLSGRRSEPIEHRIVRKDGVVRWVRNTPVPRFDSQGRLVSYDGLLQDITERKLAEEALRESEANYRLLFSASSDAIITVDGATKEIVEANEAALSLYGYTRDEFLRLKATEISGELEKTVTHIEAIASGQPEAIASGPIQRVHKKKDGHTFPVEVSSGVYRVKDRKLVCAIIRDITERKAMEDALKRSVEELEVQVKEQTSDLVRANEDLKREMKERRDAQQGLLDSEVKLYEEERRMELLKFANEVALNLMHELRNPLVAIGGFSRRISTNDYSEDKLKEYTKTIYEASMRLENVLNKVLSHLKAGAEQVKTR
jgi:PAS domain S-box-containing protein